MVALEDIAVEGRVAGDQGALERGDCLDRMIQRHRRAHGREGSCKRCRVSRVSGQLRRDRGFVAGEAQLHGVGVE